MEEKSRALDKTEYEIENIKDMDADTNAEDVLYKHKDDEMSDQQEDHDS